MVANDKKICGLAYESKFAQVLSELIQKLCSAAKEDTYLSRASWLEPIQEQDLTQQILWALQDTLNADLFLSAESSIMCKFSTEEIFEIHIQKRSCDLNTEAS